MKHTEWQRLKEKFQISQKSLTTKRFDQDGHEIHNTTLQQGSNVSQLDHEYVFGLATDSELTYLRRHWTTYNQIEQNIYVALGEQDIKSFLAPESELFQAIFYLILDIIATHLADLSPNPLYIDISFKNLSANPLSVKEMESLVPAFIEKSKLIRINIQRELDGVVEASYSGIKGPNREDLNINNIEIYITHARPDSLPDMGDGYDTGIQVFLQAIESAEGTISYIPASHKITDFYFPDNPEIMAIGGISVELKVALRKEA